MSSDTPPKPRRIGVPIPASQRIISTSQQHDINRYRQSSTRTRKEKNLQKEAIHRKKLNIKLEDQGSNYRIQQTPSSVGQTQIFIISTNV